MTKQYNSKNTHSDNINIFNRIIAIGKPNFLKILISEKDPTPTWKFWFLWNSVFTVIITIVLFFLGQNFITELEEEWWPQVPNFEITLDDGNLSTNLDEPIVFADGNFVFILDTEEIGYDESIIDEYETGIFINNEKFIAKDQKKYKTTEFYFDEIEENFIFTKLDAKSFYDETKNTIKFYIVVFLCIGLWFSITLLRLASALWWTLLTWGVGSVLKIKNWDFGIAYLLILNLYFIPLVLETILLLSLFWFPIPVIPFSTFIIFTILVGMNFHNVLTNKK